MSYNPYSENLKCKWCRKKIMDHQHDLQCDPCWEFVTRLDYALAIPSLLELAKGKIEDRIDAIREKENEEETREILENPGLMEGLKQSIKEAETGDVISLEEAEKESFKDTEN